MPGKVNPVVCEAVIQAAIRVIANDAAVTYAGFGGVGSILELNVAMPVMADALMESIRLLASSSTVLVEKLFSGLRVNADRCAEWIDQSLMLVTALAPEIGYDRAAQLAKQALAEGKTIRELAISERVLDAELLSELLDPYRMTEPER